MLEYKKCQAEHKTSFLLFHTVLYVDIGLYNLRQVLGQLFPFSVLSPLRD